MAFRAFYREDIENAIRGAHMASEGKSQVLLSVLNDPKLALLLAVYQAGFGDALNTIDATFGCDTHKSTVQFIELVSRFQSVESGS